MTFIAIVGQVVERVRGAGGAVAVEPRKFAEQGISSVAVSPAASGATAFTVAWEDQGDIAYLSVGTGTTLEIPAGEGRYANGRSDEDLRILLLAVVEGRFSERVWLDRRGRVLAARARFELPERAVTVTTVALPWLYRFRRSELRRYLPYY